MLHAVSTLYEKGEHLGTQSGTFGVRFKKNLKLETRARCKDLLLVFAWIKAILFGFFDLLFEFEYIRLLAFCVLPPLFIFLIGKYLTVLPMYLVIPLIFAPRNIVRPTIGLSVFFSAIIVFLI